MQILTQQEILQYYAEIKGLLDELFAEPDEDLELTSGDIFKLARNGMVQIFYDARENSVCVTEIVASPRKRWINIVALVGGSKGFLAMRDEFHKWALSVGACEIRGFMKEPQMRLAKRYGYEQLYAVGRFDLRRKMC